MEGYPQLKEMFQKAGWLKFIKKFDGFHKEITKSFARSFDGTELEIGDIKFTVTKSLITEATGLLRIGERWFKNRATEGEEWKTFLKTPSMDITIFKKGILDTTLKGKWRNLMLIIQKFVTCEGRFCCMFFYHINLMMHFLKGNEINLFYFLLNTSLFF